MIVIRGINGSFFFALGMRARKREMEKNKNPVTEFPAKIDKLMMAIDKVNHMMIFF
jgi:hypothetical protein